MLFDLAAKDIREGGLRLHDETTYLATHGDRWRHPGCAPRPTRRPGHRLRAGAGRPAVVRTRAWSSARDPPPVDVMGKQTMRHGAANLMATGDTSDATGDRRQATGDRRRGQETGDRRQGTGDRRQGSGDRPSIRGLSPCRFTEGGWRLCCARRQGAAAGSAAGRAAQVRRRERRPSPGRTPGGRRRSFFGRESIP